MICVNATTSSTARRSPGKQRLTRIISRKEIQQPENEVERSLRVMLYSQDVAAGHEIQFLTEQTTLDKPTKKSFLEQLRHPDWKRELTDLTQQDSILAD